MSKITITSLASALAVFAMLTAAQAGPRYVQGDGPYQVASWWEGPRVPNAAVTAVRG